MDNIQFETSLVKLKNQLIKYHPSDIASFFETHESMRTKIYEALGVKLFKNVFILLDDHVQVQFFDTLNKTQQASLLKFLDTEDIKDFLDTLKMSQQILVISLLPEKTKNEITQL
ncbi:MAG TPA: hypothetical protein GX698_04325, partial [Acholeplasmataceae bacterium]|nr:hypothetical protein [Acholeplasmataceae bacterium]